MKRILNMNKGWKITIGGIIAVIMLVIVFLVILKPARAITPALLTNVQGEVQVDSGNGYQTAANGMELLPGFKIKTGLASKASIIFYDSSIIRLTENTEIKIKSLSSKGGQIDVGVEQESGRTWNRVLSLTGKTNYEVETPNTVATVRGTAFGIDLRDGDAIFVADGNVTVTEDGEQTIVSEDHAVHFNESIDEVEQIGFQENWETFSDENIRQDLEYIKQQRLERIKELLEENEFVVEQIQARNELTEEEILELLETTHPDDYDEEFGAFAKLIPSDFEEYMEETTEEEKELEEELIEEQQERSIAEEPITEEPIVVEVRDEIIVDSFVEETIPVRDSIEEPLPIDVYQSEIRYG